MQFITDADPERHYLDKSVLLRPVYLRPAEDAEDTREMRILRAYQSLCTPGSVDETWPALDCGPENPGPFQRGWQASVPTDGELPMIGADGCLAAIVNQALVARDQRDGFPECCAAHRGIAQCAESSRLHLLAHMQPYQWIGALLNRALE